jgi:hypothetical protein
MSKKKPSLEDIDDLNSKLKATFLALENEIAEIEKRSRFVELEFMYGNITEDFYSEKMARLDEDMTKVRSKLEKIHDIHFLG